MSCSYEYGDWESVVGTLETSCTSMEIRKFIAYLGSYIGFTNIGFNYSYLLAVSE